MNFAPIAILVLEELGRRVEASKAEQNNTTSEEIWRLVYNRYLEELRAVDIADKV